MRLWAAPVSANARTIVSSTRTAMTGRVQAGKDAQLRGTHDHLRVGFTRRTIGQHGQDTLGTCGLPNLVEFVGIIGRREEESLHGFTFVLFRNFQEDPGIWILCFPR